MPSSQDRPGRLTAEEFEQLLVDGLLPEKIEAINGRLSFAVNIDHGTDEWVCPPRTARAIAERFPQIRVRTCVDAVLDDPASLADLRRRLKAQD